MCALRLDTPAGPYAEGAHIRPLGAPHRGPDTLDNLLCLCPNHHLLFDIGAITIADDMTLIGAVAFMRNLTVQFAAAALLLVEGFR
jgi:putative restriction endonuclease